jgi:hypothetical protein
VHTNDGIPHITCDGCAVKFIHPSLIAGNEHLYDDLDDAYDVAPTKGGKPINNRMGTLNRVQGMLNRHRNAGRIK